MSELQTARTAMNYLQKEKVRECFYCFGKKDTCPQYMEYTELLGKDLKQCPWNMVVRSDIEKIITGNGVLTFPVLEEIIREDSTERRQKPR